VNSETQLASDEIATVQGRVVERLYTQKSRLLGDGLEGQPG
jgi:hypothetical protein